MRIVGYADRFSVLPIETVRIMVSCELPAYRAQLVRLLSAETAPDGSGFAEVLVREISAAGYPGRLQDFPLGSYARVPDHPRLRGTGSFTIQAWIYPTTPTKGLQGLVTKSGPRCGHGYALQIEESGGLAFRLGGSDREPAGPSVAVPWLPHTWYFVAARYDREDDQAMLLLRPHPTPPRGMSEARAEAHGIPLPEVGSELPLLIGAVWGVGPDGSPRVTGHFNGKIERPRIFGAALTDGELDALWAGAEPASLGRPVLADWDFAREISTAIIRDTTVEPLDGALVNMPTRAVTDHAWDGSILDWTRDQRHYGAIHFHDDDLEDAAWNVDFEIALPRGLPSGIYAVKLSAGDGEDYVPLFVRPAERRPTSAVLFLLSTNTYLAYANWQLAMSESNARSRGFPFPYPLSEGQRYAMDHHLLSLYDRHSDGSGVCYSSRLRPILNMRPKVNDEASQDGRGYPHGLKADLQVAGWLAAKGIRVDIATDEDLHAEGAGLLGQYRAVLTGTHPEYWTAAMLDVGEAYLQGGGRLIYLGGNGFYWVTSYDPGRPHIIEVRRSNGSRAWSARVGEYHHSTTGEPGGIWRERGRPPQRFVGVGFTAQGNGPGRPYRRTPASFDPPVAWIFEGVGSDEPIGTTGLVMGAAGGLEVDRADVALGTPPHALVVASATDFPDMYQHVVEEVPSSDSKQSGSVESRVRADMTFVETPNGGAVFSVGSIAFGGALSTNGYDNPVSRITENVVRAFMADRPLPGG